MHVFEANAAGKRRPGAHDYGDRCGDDRKRAANFFGPCFTFPWKGKLCTSEVGNGEKVEKSGEIARGPGLVREEFVLQKAPGAVRRERHRARVDGDTLVSALAENLPHLETALVEHSMLNRVTRNVRRPFVALPDHSWLLFRADEFPFLFKRERI